VLQITRAAIVLCLLGGPAHAGGDDPFNGGTMAAQAGTGVVGGALLGAGGGLVGGGIGYAINSQNRGLTAPVVGLGIGIAIGISVGIVGGLDYAGDERGANGSVLGSSLGLAAGWAAFVSFEVLAHRADKKFSFPVHLVVGLTTLLGGSLVGYHVSADSNGGASKLSVPITGFVF
jgi:hypothetical protein